MTPALYLCNNRLAKHTREATSSFGLEYGEFEVLINLAHKTNRENHALMHRRIVADELKVRTLRLLGTLLAIKHAGMQGYTSRAEISERLSRIEEDEGLWLANQVTEWRATRQAPVFEIQFSSYTAPTQADLPKRLSQILSAYRPSPKTSIALQRTSVSKTNGGGDGPIAFSSSALKGGVFTTMQLPQQQTRAPAPAKGATASRGGCQVLPEVKPSREGAGSGAPRRRTIDRTEIGRQAQLLADRPSSRAGRAEQSDRERSEAGRVAAGGCGGQKQPGVGCNLPPLSKLPMQKDAVGGDRRNSQKATETLSEAAGEQARLLQLEMGWMGTRQRRTSGFLDEISLLRLQGQGENESLDAQAIALSSCCFGRSRMTSSLFKKLPVSRKDGARPPTINFHASSH